VWRKAENCLLICCLATATLDQSRSGTSAKIERLVLPEAAMPLSGSRIDRIHGR
jgi:hypothetical protein